MKKAISTLTLDLKDFKQPDCPCKAEKQPDSAWECSKYADGLNFIF